jgi:polyisoprenyl-phosphate glycosyltransferase
MPASVPEISVAVPAYNEEGCLPELYRRVRETMERAGLDWELVIADDGSEDRTREIIRDLGERDPRVKGVFLSRNFGHTPAYMASMEHARGDWVVVMDGDLQDEPEVIPNLLARAREGYDVVYVVKGKRQEGPAMRMAFSGYYRVAKHLSSVPQPAHAGPFCLMSRRVVEEIRRIPERSVFFPGIRAYVGFRQTGVEVSRPARADGASRIRLAKRIVGALDGIFAFSQVPLRLATYLGAFTALLAGVLGVVFLYLGAFTDVPVAGWTSLITVILFLGGVQLLTLGILGEYLGRVYEEVKGRPRYVVAERVNMDEEEDAGQAARSLARRDGR